MKKLPVLFFYIISSLTLSGCFNKLKCDHTDNVKLGDTDYSTEFKQWNIEQSNKLIEFSNSDGGFMLRQSNGLGNEPRQLRAHDICKSIDIKPYTAYAYYEYENLSNFYNSDSIVLAIEPEISIENGRRIEVIYLSFNKAGTPGIKGKIPVFNIQYVESEEPYGVLFEFHKAIKLGDETLQNIWVYEKGGEGLFYSKKDGVVAIKHAEEFYFKK